MYNDSAKMKVTKMMYMSQQGIGGPRAKSKVTKSMSEGNRRPQSKELSYKVDVRGG